MVAAFMGLLEPLPMLALVQGGLVATVSHHDTVVHDSSPTPSL
jgi:hypothetical protein